MNTTLFIPEKMKVGFQNRSGTYTGKLAYITYYDKRGKLRKEHSWSGWRNKDIPAEDFKNEPTEGFVLNKKAGDYKTHWNKRSAVIRVYDPRGYEFEIKVDNLMYILENTSCIKGKGLEGEFVYALDGKDLILMPVESVEYKEIAKYNKLIRADNYTMKDVTVGGTYLNKDMEEEIYLGRFMKYEISNGYANKYQKVKDVYSSEKYKSYFFYNLKTGYISTYRTLGNKIIDTVTEDMHNDMSDFLDKLETSPLYVKIDQSKAEVVDLSQDDIEEFKERVMHYAYQSSCDCLIEEDGEIIMLRKFKDYDENYYWLDIEVGNSLKNGYFNQISLSRTSNFKKLHESTIYSESKDAEGLIKDLNDKGLSLKKVLFKFENGRLFKEIKR